MKPWARLTRNQKGVALPLALFALVMLTGLLLAFLSMAGMEPSMAANLSDVTRGRYLADAGIEWAFDQLANNTNWNTFLTTGGGVMANNMTFPGLTAAAGTFTVRVRNDVQAGDTVLTGQGALDAGGANNDTNGIVIATATGTYQQVTRQIQVVVRRLALPPLPGTWNCPGLQCDVNPGGTAHLHTNGVDYNRDGSLGTGPLKFGMTTPSGINPVTGTTFEKSVEDSLTRHHKNEMTGRDQTKPCCVAIARGSDDDCPCEGERSIIPQDLLPAKDQLTPQKVADFVNQIKGRGGVSVIKVNPAKALVLNSGVPTDPSVSVNLGTVAKPTITYIQGTPDPAERYTSLTLNGNTSGAGILILDDADMAISGTFRWDGVIIITGKNVGVTFKKGSRSFLYGAMVVDETDKTERAGAYEMLIETNTHGDSSVDQFTTFYSSQQNLDMVQNLPGLVRTSSWREM